jgi:hypothetical protein
MLDALKLAQGILHRRQVRGCCVGKVAGGFDAYEARLIDDAISKAEGK